MPRSFKNIRPPKGYTHEERAPLSREERVELESFSKPQILEFWSILDFKKNEQGNLTKDSFIALNLCLGKSLCEDFREDEILHGAEEDWERDVQGRSSMSLRDFRNSILELVELWAVENTVFGYRSFLEELLSAVSESSKMTREPGENLGGLGGSLGKGLRGRRHSSLDEKTEATDPHGSPSGSTPVGRQLRKIGEVSQLTKEALTARLEVRDPTPTLTL